jgi:O-glycosyl hydrolase
VRIAIRKQLSDTARKYDVDFWQTEYCMLAEGFREGTAAPRSAMDCALFLAKMIHSDLTIANAAAWQYWNAYEPGKADTDTRYYLIALDPLVENNFTVTKNLWALGHFSLFIRPGMHRLLVNRSDNSSVAQDGQHVMISAFAKDKNELVVVAINYTTDQKKIKIAIAGKEKFKHSMRYTTTGDADVNMKASMVDRQINELLLAPRSISTFVMTN